MNRQKSILLLLSFILLYPNIVHAQELTLEAIHRDYQFYAHTVDGIHSMANGIDYSVLENNQIVQYDYETGLKTKIVLDASDLPKEYPSIEEYQFSNDEKKILITTRVKPIYRHSYTASYLVYNLMTGKCEPLDEKGNQQLATFSPDGNKVAFVRDNNLYYKDLISDKIIQITYDGAVNQIINGAPDWVYEEEFGFSQGYTWSPDSRKIAYYRFDESQVREFDMMMYQSLYPEAKRFKYPKAGEANSKVSVHVYHIGNELLTNMNIGDESDQYIPRILWTADPENLCIIKLNRLQNDIQVLLSDATSGYSYAIYQEKNARYIAEVDDHYIHFLNNNKQFIIKSERSGYFHYYRYSMAGKLQNAVTAGNWDVTGFLGMDEKSGKLYYSSNQSHVIGQETWSVQLDGTHMRKISVQKGTNTDAFSTTYKYFINSWSDANTPTQYAVYRINGSLIRVLESNEDLKIAIQKTGFSRKEFIKVPGGNHVELNAYILKPADFDSTRKYPLFMSVYGGPESQEVTDAWDNNLAWQQYLVQHGIIVACVDNRGTNGRGEEFRKCIYKQLGKLETEDQIAAARFLGSKPWIDENRIGIWGWSYGGYMTLLCLTKGSDVFQMGIAVAPVTNWRFYDNIYTERYMQRPQDNPNGYDDNSPIHYADQLKGKLLIIHGTADDNVHLQNSIEMANQLILRNKQFQQFMYPNKNHSIYGGNTRLHLYTMMTDFILNNL